MCIRDSLEVRAEGFHDVPPIIVELDPGPHERIIQLDAIPGEVAVEVLDPAGRPAAAELVFSGPMDHPGTAVDAGETAIIELRPGEWTVVAASALYGPARASITVESGVTGELAIQLTERIAAMEESAVVLEEPIQFDFDRATLRAEAAAQLDAVAALLLSRPSVTRLEVAGHTDLSLIHI